MPLIQTFKRASLATGLYRPARFLYQQMFNRKRLRKVRSEVAFYRNLIPANSLCFDVGANIGQQAEPMIAAGNRVVAFEPEEDCVRELKARFAGNPGAFQVEQAAVGSVVGHSILHVTNHRVTSSLIPNWHPADVVRQERVRMTTLDEAMKTFGRPYYIKIDTEGWELEVLRGLSQPVAMLSFEYHLHSSKTAIVCLDNLKRFGQLLVNITPRDQLVFNFSEWLSVDEFLGRYPSEFEGYDAWVYGDIFVKLIR